MPMLVCKIVSGLLIDNRVLLQMLGESGFVSDVLVFSLHPFFLKQFKFSFFFRISVDMAPQTIPGKVLSPLCFGLWLVYFGK